MQINNETKLKLLPSCWKRQFVWLVMKHKLQEKFILSIIAPCEGGEVDGHCGAVEENKRTVQFKSRNSLSTPRLMNENYPIVSFLLLQSSTMHCCNWLVAWTGRRRRRASYSTKPTRIRVQYRTLGTTVPQAHCHFTCSL